MNYQQLAQIIKIKRELMAGANPDPKTTEVSQEFVIPSPKKDENQKDFITRCISKIGKEYTKPGQSYAVCSGKWSDKE